MIKLEFRISENFLRISWIFFTMRNVREILNSKISQMPTTSTSGLQMLKKIIATSSSKFRRSKMITKIVETSQIELLRHNLKFQISTVWMLISTNLSMSHAFDWSWTFTKINCVGGTLRVSKVIYAVELMLSKLHL